MKYKLSTFYSKSFHVELKQLTSKLNHYELFILSKVILLITFGLIAMLMLWSSSIVVVLSGYVVLGIFFILIGINFGHDAIHGVLSKYKFLNWVGGRSLTVAGISTTVWDITHNQLHHGFTNVLNVDPDIEGGRIVDWPQIDGKKKHSPLFLLLIYSMSMIYWVFWKDFRVINEGGKDLKTKIITWTLALFTKVVHIILVFIIPVFMGQISLVIFLLGMLIMYMTMGLLFSHLSLVAHINENVKFVNNQDVQNYEWAELQVLTTANFRLNPVAEYLLGGTNKQIEHHLFRDFNHYQLMSISEKIKSKVESRGWKYNQFESIWSAIKSHYNHMK